VSAKVDLEREGGRAPSRWPASALIGKARPRCSCDHGRRCPTGEARRIGPGGSPSPRRARGAGSAACRPHPGRGCSSGQHDPQGLYGGQFAQSYRGNRGVEGVRQGVAVLATSPARPSARIRRRKKRPGTARPTGRGPAPPAASPACPLYGRKSGTRPAGLIASRSVLLFDAHRFFPDLGLGGAFLLQPLGAVPLQRVDLLRSESVGDSATRET